MKIYREMSLEQFEPWSGAISTHDAIRDAGKLDTLEAILEDMYPDGIDETTLNDILCFEPETVYEWLNMPDPDADEDEEDEDEDSDE